MTIAILDASEASAIASQVWCALDRVAQEQGEGKALAIVLQNLHASTAYLGEKIGPLATLEELGGLKEAFMHAALAVSRRQNVEN